jgi:hypothetical protein
MTTDRIAALVLENEGLRKALSRLVADYGDVPDATDADGQAVFDYARVFLSRPSPLPSAVAEVVKVALDKRWHNIILEMRREHDVGDGHFSTEEVELAESIWEAASNYALAALTPQGPKP